MSETLEYLKTFAQFPLSLRRFLKTKLTLEQSIRIIHDQMEHREDNFLRVAERSIYGNPRSPYLALLKLAGCELGDLRALVKQQGLEGALRHLRGQGVYVTFEEFKGRQPIRRNGMTIPVRARDYDNPFVRRDFTVQSGGSSGTALNVGVDLGEIAARAPHELVSFAAHGLLDAPIVRWKGILPNSTLRNILQDEYFGRSTLLWFSPIGFRASKHWLKYGLASFYCILWMRLQGVRVPWPTYVGVDQALVIARRVKGMLDAQRQCLLHTNMSNAMRVSLAAQQAGLDLHGATFCGSGEPTTPAKVRQVVQSGAAYLPHYGAVESSRIGIGCAQPCDVGDMHLFSDAFALFTHPYRVEAFDVTVPAFNLTTLTPAAPKLMLNVQMDDYGIVEERRCGCALGEYGYTTHLREIRSYNKLTGEGVTLIGNELMRILEEILPARFGGSPLNYQLREEEDGQGFTRLYLVISPRVQIADERQVVDVVLNALRDSSAMADAVRTIWEQTQTIQIKRMEPALTEHGKLLPLYIQRARKKS